MVLDDDMDRISATTTQNRSIWKSTLLLQDFLAENDLCDAWRICNPNKKEFTWSRLHPTYTASRLDYILMPSAHVTRIKECSIQEGCKTDHRRVHLSMTINEVKRGPGIWKINNKILTEESFKNQLCKEIQNIKDCEMEPIQKWNTANTRWDHWHGNTRKALPQNPATSCMG